MRRSWSRRGVTPVIEYSPSRRRLHAVGAICLTPGGTVREHFQIRRKGISDADLFWFLVQLRRYYNRPLIAVWDNWSVHTKVEKWFKLLELEWIEFERLPPYAPELNPVEFLWSQTKYHDLSNYVPPASTDDWITDVETSLRAANRRKKLLKSFFKGAGLDINEFN